MQETASYRLVNMSSSGGGVGGGEGGRVRGDTVEAEAWLGAAAVMAQFEGAWVGKVWFHSVPIGLRWNTHERPTGLVAGYQASATGQAKPLTVRARWPLAQVNCIMYTHSDMHTYQYIVSGAGAVPG